ncbi:hypothetical protein KKF91_09050 [Myxococcota bacterium]|nr:hypothetical protein [Myxococcota bacterium]MBU1430688.1 hypothetical protein [Myxococcota bacterium]MBU1899486.1 hypothetical protein [Myxococcota bacterium]
MTTPLAYWPLIHQVHHARWRSGSILQLARVEGDVTPAEVEAALVILRARHPRLRVRFEEGALRLVEADALPLEWLDRPARMPTDAEAALAAPFDERLWRLRVFAAPGGVTLMLTIHHALADAKATALFIHELLRCLAGDPPQGDFELKPIRYRRLEGAAPAALVTEGLPPSPWPFDAYAPLEARQPQIFTGDLVEVDQLVALARARGLRFNALLSAAFLAACGRRTALETAVDLRGQLAEGSAATMACLMMMLTTRPSPCGDLWIAAARCQAALESAWAQRGRRGFTPRRVDRGLLESMIEANLSGAEAEGRFAGAPSLSNLGRVDLPEHYGALRLVDLRFTTAQIAAYFPLFLSVTTLHGRARFMLSAPSPLIEPSHAARILADLLQRLRRLAATAAP